jgi:hypothetical protein
MSAERNWVRGPDDERCDMELRTGAGGMFAYVTDIAHAQRLAREAESAPDATYAERTLEAVYAALPAPLPAAVFRYRCSETAEWSGCMPAQSVQAAMERAELLIALETP